MILQVVKNNLKKTFVFIQKQFLFISPMGALANWNIYTPGLLGTALSTGERVILIFTM